MRILMKIGSLLAAASFSCVALAEKLPAGIQWETNEKDAVFASPEAKRGGTFREFMMSFPLTLRYVGPDSNGGFAGYVRSMMMGLVDFHPVTRNLVPALATHWAFDKDRKTIYFKLDPRGKWSDGKAVTADDYLYTLEFMRSKYIMDPWYNDYYTTEIDKVVKFDDYTIAVRATKPQPHNKLVLTVALSPLPRHFFGTIDADYVKKFNWSSMPGTGPYAIDKVEKGKFITMRRVDKWWANDLKYYKHRFNPDVIRIDVIRDLEVALEKFKKGELDAFGAARPDLWYDKMKGAEFDNGYIHKIWFYNDVPKPISGFWLNLDKEIWKEKNLRYAFAHAMDFSSLNKKLLRGDYELMHVFFTGYDKYTNTKIRAREFNIVKVEDYMKSAGWKRGSDGIWTKGDKRFSVTVTYGAAPHTDRLAFLKEEAKKAGVEIQLQLLDSSASFKAAQEKKVEAWWGGFGTAEAPQPWEFFHSENAHKPQTNNIMNIDDKAMDQAVDAFRNATEEKELYASNWRIEEKLFEIGSFVPSTVVPYFREAYWRYLKLPTIPATKRSEAAMDSVGLQAGGLFWIDQTLQKETIDARKSGKKLAPVTIIDKTYKP